MPGAPTVPNVRRGKAPRAMLCAKAHCSSRRPPLVPAIPGHATAVFGAEHTLPRHSFRDAKAGHRASGPPALPPQENAQRCATPRSETQQTRRTINHDCNLIFLSRERVPRRSRCPFQRARFSPLGGPTFWPQVARTARDSKGQNTDRWPVLLLFCAELSAPRGSRRSKFERSRALRATLRTC